MIKYIFEDKESSGISQLYMAGYRDTSNFIFANGKDNIYNTIFREVPNTDTEIIIIMDLVYDNGDTVDCYNNLIDKLVYAGYTKFSIFPIVCSEYYMIQLLKELGLMTGSLVVDICIEQGEYKNLTIPLQNSYITSSKNFEKFCKHVLEVMGSKCTSHGKEFYTQDCECTAPMKSCTMKIGLVDKAIRLLKKYPCVPLNPIKKVHEPLTPTEMDTLHRRLIDEYNKKVDEHIKSDMLQGKQKTLYVKADYMYIRVKEALRRREIRKARGKQ